MHGYFQPSPIANISNWPTSFTLQKGDPLPSLPVPELEVTMQKYLAQVEAVAPSHLDQTRTLVKAFLAGSGPKLQQRLLERRQNVVNWVSTLYT